jgi:hypothetical protein
MTVWTARVAAVLYVCSLVWMLRGRWRWARWASTAGVVAYLAHVWCAFAFSYEWSHAVAYRETARQTGELFGVAWGGGLWLNYLFTAVWVGEVVFWRPRIRWWAHAFLAFMIVNGTVVVWVMRWLR